VDVYVREKVRVESADPSLLSLSSKLTALSHTLALARRNLAAVMGEEVEGED
jgi:outer membrane protein TolC